MLDALPESEKSRLTGTPVTRQCRKILAGLLKMYGSRGNPTSHEAIREARHYVGLEGNGRDTAQDRSRHRGT